MKVGTAKSWRLTRRVIAASLLLTLLAALAIGVRDDARIHSIEGRSMGTRWSVSIDTAWLDARAQARLAGVAQACQERLERIDAVFSTWRPDSYISRLNRGQAGGDGAAPFNRVLDYARGIAEGNERFLDFGLQETLVGLGFEPGAHSPRGHNLSALVKGHAVDELSALLAGMGFGDSLVEIGGEIRARCQRRKQPWRIAIQHPQRPYAATPILTLELCNKALATSGDYHNITTIGDRPASHLIDPGQRAPKHNRTRSATVIGERAITADAYATAFAVSGLARSDEVVVRHPLRALFLIEGAQGAIEPVWRDFAGQGAKITPP